MSACRQAAIILRIAKREAEHRLLLSLQLLLGSRVALPCRWFATQPAAAVTQRPWPTAWPLPAEAASNLHLPQKLRPVQVVRSSFQP